MTTEELKDLTVAHAKKLKTRVLGPLYRAEKNAGRLVIAELLKAELKRRQPEMDHWFAIQKKRAAMKAAPSSQH